MAKKLKSLKTLKRDAWSLMSEYVRRKEKECFTCGAKGDWKEAHAGHFVHKDCLDFDYLNIHRQCVVCNTWKHGNLGVYAVKLDKTYGTGTAESLIGLGHMVKKFTRSELEETIKTLRGLLNG